LICDYCFANDKNIFKRNLNDSNGLGKPERLKKKFQEYLSRRITSEHRLVYKIIDDLIIIAQCKYHY